MSKKLLLNNNQTVNGTSTLLFSAYDVDIMVNTISADINLIETYKNNTVKIQYSRLDNSSCIGYCGLVLGQYHTATQKLDLIFGNMTEGASVNGSINFSINKTYTIIQRETSDENSRLYKVLEEDVVVYEQSHTVLPNYGYMFMAVGGGLIKSLEIYSD